MKGSIFMNEETEIQNLLAEIDVGNLIDFLVIDGWKEYSQPRTDIAIYQKEITPDDFFQLNIPLNKNLSDYDHAMKECIRELSITLDKTIEAVLLQIAGTHQI